MFLKELIKQYPVIVYDWIGGMCPVQAEGTINGVNFYFRARGSRWSLEIYKDPIIKCFAHWVDESFPAGSKKFSAGYMPVDVAKQIIFEEAKYIDW